MSTIHSYNVNARRRIQTAVELVENIQRNSQRGPRSGTPQPSRMVLAEADIEHNTAGNVKIIEGTTWDSTYSPVGDEIEVFNPWQKVWKGAPLLIEHGSARIRDERAARWVIRRSWSATRLTGIAPSNIAPGATGTINMLETMDGYFEPPDVEVFLPTTFVEIESGVIVWAELKWDAVAGESIWQVYSADCTGTGGTSDPDTMINKGAYVPGTGYEQGHVVVDEGYLAVANSNAQETPQNTQGDPVSSDLVTYDRPRPTPVGEQFSFLPTTPSWTTGNFSTSQLTTGNLYTFNDDFFLYGARLFVPTAGDYAFQFTNLATGQFNRSPFFSVTTPGEYDWPTGSILVLEGDQLELGLVRNGTVTGTPTATFYDYKRTNGTPSSGEMWHQNNSYEIRTPFVDENSDNWGSVYNNVKVGDTLQGGGILWEIVEVLNLTGSRIDVRVTPEQRIGNEDKYTFTWTLFGDSNLDYYQLVNYWIGNQPTQATVQGFYELSDGTRVVNDTAYGVDIVGQFYELSPAWDILSVVPGAIGFQ